MDAELIWELFTITGALIRETVFKDELTDDEVESMLSDLGHKSKNAYEDHTGKPLFPNLIKEEDAV